MRDESATGDGQHKTLAKLGVNPKRQRIGVNLTKAIQPIPKEVGCYLQDAEFMENCYRTVG